jgi:hypothetical protein
MAKPSRKPNNRTRFFVKEDDGIYTVYDEFFQDIQSRDEALVIAMRTLGEIHTVLAHEALEQSTLFIGNMKIVTGLQRCLDELEKRWPFLLLEMHSVSRRINGNVIDVC